MNRAFALLKENRPIIKRWIAWLWAWLIPSLILAVLYFKLWDSPVSFFQIPQTGHWFYLAVVLALLPINIWLETAKWKYLIRQWVNAKFIDCFKIIMAGKSLNAISPLGLGEAFAKYTQFEKEDLHIRITTIAIARITQMIPTLIFGSISVYFLIYNGFDQRYALLILMAGLCFLAISVIVIAWNKKACQWFLRYLTILKSIAFSVFFSAFMFSFLRFLVFTFQFILLFYWLQIDLNFQIVLLGVFWVFFFKTIVPEVSVLGDLANRELSAFAFFSLYMTDIDLVSIASFCIWLINIILPAFVGLFFVKRLNVPSI